MKTTTFLVTKPIITYMIKEINGKCDIDILKYRLPSNSKKSLVINFTNGLVWKITKMTGMLDFKDQVYKLEVMENE